jgi:hypothetical protein
MNNASVAKVVNEWVMTSDMSRPYKGPVFGGHNAKVKAMTEGFKAKFDFQEY